MPKLKIRPEKKATCHLMVTNQQHKDFFRIAIAEQRPITHIVEDMLALYRSAKERTQKNEGDTTQKL